MLTTSNGSSLVHNKKTEDVNCVGSMVLHGMKFHSILHSSPTEGRYAPICRNLLLPTPSRMLWKRSGISCTDSLGLVLSRFKGSTHKLEIWLSSTKVGLQLSSGALWRVIISFQAGPVQERHLELQVLKKRRFRYILGYTPFPVTSVSSASTVKQQLGKSPSISNPFLSTKFA